MSYCRIVTSPIYPWLENPLLCFMCATQLFLFGRKFLRIPKHQYLRISNLSVIAQDFYLNQLNTVSVGVGSRLLDAIQ